MSIVTGIVGGSATGQPIAQLAARVLLAACAGGLVLCGIVLARGRAYGPWLASTVMLSAFLALGAAEWVREDLRKPFVIGNYMFVNSVRLADLRTIDSDGVLKTALWTRLPGDLAARPGRGARCAGCDAGTSRGASGGSGLGGHATPAAHVAGTADAAVCRDAGRAARPCRVPCRPWRRAARGGRALRRGGGRGRAVLQRELLDVPRRGRRFHVRRERAVRRHAVRDD